MSFETLKQPLMAFIHRREEIQMPFEPSIDPRDKPFEIPWGALQEETLDALIESYCTQFHGVNDSEDPIGNKPLVRAALVKGDLCLWFDPVEGVASLHPREDKKP